MQRFKGDDLSQYRNQSLVDVNHSIASRSGPSVTSATVTKHLPDPLKVAKDIREQLKASDVSYPMRHKIVNSLREAEVLINCYKHLRPFFRKPLIDLRYSIRHKIPGSEDKVVDIHELFVARLEKVQELKWEILEDAETKKEDTLDKEKKNVHVFQVHIEENIRIVNIDSIIDLNTKMDTAKKFKKLLVDIESLIEKVDFANNIKDDMYDILQMMNVALAFDGIIALKVRFEMIQLRNAIVKGPEALDEVKHRLKNLRVTCNAIIMQCDYKRGLMRNYVNDVTKSLLEMDAGINARESEAEKGRTAARRTHNAASQAS